jgi:hypothetical protein
MHADITVGGLVTANAEGGLSASTRPPEFRSPAKLLPGSPKAASLRRRQAPQY